jgi:lipoprotein-anchoring transpeptidase ErfK/SrfK
MFSCRTVAIGFVCFAVLAARSALAQDCDAQYNVCQEKEYVGPPLNILPDLDSTEPAEPVPPGGLPMTGNSTASRQDAAGVYASVSAERFAVPAVNLSKINPEFLRKIVYYPTHERSGTIVIDPQHHFLYLVQAGGRAIRYGVGVGRQGFGWSGVATIHDKQEWPDWYPPKEMVQRQPELRGHLSELQGGLGIPGGPRNPLGSRALYLWQGNKDTLYRIHGTVEPWTIGKSVSSGCIRMINQDVIDLYARTPVGARVVVLPVSRQKFVTRAVAALVNEQ